MSFYRYQAAFVMSACCIPELFLQVSEVEPSWAVTDLTENGKSKEVALAIEETQQPEQFQSDSRLCGSREQHRLQVHNIIGMKRWCRIRGMNN